MLTQGRVWPPVLTDLTKDMSVDDELDEEVLQLRLDSAVSFVEDVRADISWSGDDQTRLPTDRLWLGTLALARRWYQRRMSPDGLVNLGEMGSVRVSSGDPDIDRQLRIGRFRQAASA